MTVSGNGSCQSGPIGSAFGSVGTTPVTFTVAYTDAATKAIVTPGLPKLSVSATSVTGGTIGVSVNQATQKYVLTPSASGVSGTINVQAVQADSTGSFDGLRFTKTKSYTFATGDPPPSSFLAVVEQFGVGSGAVDLFTVALGGSGAADTISAFSPATLATTNSNGGSGPPDVDNPLDLIFDSSGDLLIGNGGTTTGSPVDNGNLACVPVGAIATGQNTSTTITTNVDDPVGIASTAATGASRCQTTRRARRFNSPSSYSPATTPRPPRGATSPRADMVASAWPIFQRWPQARMRSRSQPALRTIRRTIPAARKSRSSCQPARRRAARRTSFRQGQGRTAPRTPARSLRRTGSNPAPNRLGLGEQPARDREQLRLPQAADVL